MGRMDAPRTARMLEYVRHLGISMLAGGESPPDVAELLGVSERSVWRWQRLWRRDGAAGLAARPGRGRPPKLTDGQAALVLSWVDRSPGEFGFATDRWTAPRLAAVLWRELRVRMNHRYLNDWLARRGVTPQVPQRVPRERDEAAVAAWVAGRWPLIKKTSSTAARPSASRTRAGSC
jgi:transposase